MRLIAISLLFATPLAAQSRDTVYMFPINYLAVTACDSHGQIKSYGDLALPDSILALVRVHEAKHRDQAARYPSCKAWIDATAHNAFLAAEYEVEAYAASIRKGRELGMDTDALLSEFRDKVNRQFNGQVPLPVIMGWFRKYETAS